MALIWRKKISPGQLIKLYIIAYLAFRVGTEFIPPEARLLSALTGYQWAVLPWLACLARCGGATRRDGNESAISVSKRSPRAPETPPAVRFCHGLDLSSPKRW
jgi:hypothetical protein